MSNPNLDKSGQETVTIQILFWAQEGPEGKRIPQFRGVLTYLQTASCSTKIVLGV